MNDHVKIIGDILSGGICVGTLINLLPALAALFTIMWTGIRIYESATVQGLIAKWQSRRPS